MTKNLNSKLFVPFFILLLLMSFVERYVFGIQSDTSMQISVLENIFRGMILGVDVMEVSPPMSILMFAPGIFLGKITGLGSDTGVTIVTYVLFFLSLALFLRIDLKSCLLKENQRPFFYLIFTFTFISFYYDFFSQREHYAILLMMPYFALQASYLLNSSPITKSEKIVIGIMMGLGTAVKPHFALVFGGLALLNAAKERHILALFSIDKIFAVITAVAYNIYCVRIFPEYFLYMDSYLMPFYVSFGKFFIDILMTPYGFTFLLFLVIFASITIRFFSKKNLALLNVLLLSSALFCIVFFLQRKGFPYHLYPAIALLSLCFPIIGLELCGELIKRGVHSKQQIIILNVGILFATGFYFTEGFNNFRLAPHPPSLKNLVMQISKNPKMLSFHPDLAAGHPLVRDAKGQWVGTYPSIWGFTNVLPEEQKYLFGKACDLDKEQCDVLSRKRYAIIDQLLVTVKNIKARKPDIIISWDNNVWRNFIFAVPEVKDAMVDYVRVDNNPYPYVELWHRKPVDVPS